MKWVPQFAHRERETPSDDVQIRRGSQIFHVEVRQGAYGQYYATCSILPGRVFTSSTAQGAVDLCADVAAEARGAS